jgi:ABC-type multidrug transport system permease subunit
MTMNRWYPLAQLFLARVREFYREPEAIFWVYGFPVLLAIGLGIAFMSRKPEPPEVDIQRTAATAEDDALLEQLQKAGVKVEVHDAGECAERLRTGKTELYIIPEADGYRYVYDDRRTESEKARYQIDSIVQRWKAGHRVWTAEDQLVEEVGNRYIDFLLPGLMGLNLMGGGLWGVGFVLVDMRVRKLLKRLLATPMRRSDFLLSVLIARLVFLLPEMLLLVLVGRLIFDVPIRGSALTLILVIVVGACAFSGVGLLVACRADKTETVSGLMNLVMLPMWLLSGTFFSSRRFPDVAQPFIQALPLTQLNDALRQTMLEGASVVQVAGHLGILALWAVITFALALRWFRWQ